MEIDLIIDLEILVACWNMGNNVQLNLNFIFNCMVYKCFQIYKHYLILLEVSLSAKSIKHN